MLHGNVVLSLCLVFAGWPILINGQLNLIMRNPLVLHGNHPSPIQVLQSLQKRLDNLEEEITTGAVWGCEHGEVGPLTFLRPRATVRFSRRYSTPPAMIVALSGFAGSMTSTAVRATTVSTTTATITLLDRNSVNLNQVRASWMACPQVMAPNNALLHVRSN